MWNGYCKSLQIPMRFENVHAVIQMRLVDNAAFLHWSCQYSQLPSSPVIHAFGIARNLALLGWQNR